MNENLFVATMIVVTSFFAMSLGLTLGMFF